MQRSSRKMSWLHAAQPILLLALFVLVSMQASRGVAAGAFERTGPGLIKDNKTGLIWQEKRSGKMRSVGEVQQYLDQLNQGTDQGWRLPTKWELYDLFMLFDLKKNGDVELKLEGSYWLQDESGSPYPGAWEQGDQCGTERSFFKPRSGYVRAVR